MSLSFSPDESKLYVIESDPAGRKIFVFDVVDGGTTTIEFDLDGAVATAYFPADRHELPWTLSVANETTELTRLDTVPDGAAFHCASE